MVLPSMMRTMISSEPMPTVCPKPRSDASLTVKVVVSASTGALSSANALVMRLGARGSYGAASSAKTPTNSSTAMTSRPNAPSGCRRVSCSARRGAEIRGGVSFSNSRGAATSCAIANALGVPDPRVQPAVRHVHDQVGDDVRRREQQDHTLDHEEIAPEDRLQHVLADAIQIEHHLYDHRSADEGAHVEPDDSQHRNKGVLEGVTHHHRALAQPLGPGGADVVVPQHLQERRAGEAHDRGRYRQGKDEGGEEELLHVYPGVVQERYVAAAELGRRPVEPAHTEGDDQYPQPEGGDGEPEYAAHPRQPVQRRAGPDCGYDSRRYAEQERHEDRHHHELHGYRQAAVEFRGDGESALGEGVTEVEAGAGYGDGADVVNDGVGDVPDPVAVLHVPGTVKAHLVSQVVQDLGSASQPAAEDGGVAGDHSEHGEGEEGDAHHDRDEDNQAPQDVVPHLITSAPASPSILRRQAFSVHISVPYGPYSAPGSGSSRLPPKPPPTPPAPKCTCFQAAKYWMPPVMVIWGPCSGRIIRCARWTISILFASSNSSDWASMSLSSSGLV